MPFNTEMLSRFFTRLVLVILLTSLLTVTLTRFFSQQAGWNVVMFGIDWSSNLTLAQAVESRTWMVDVNTGIRERLPFRYQDGIDGGRSADGNRVLGSRPRLGTGADAGSDLVMFYRGPEERQLTDDPSYNAEPEAVDDLRRIVFVSNRDGPSDVYILLLDQDDNPTSLRRVTNDDNIEREPEWLTRDEYQLYLEQHRAGASTIIIDEEALNAWNEIRRGNYTTPTPPP
jgi:hypothetical protein